MKKQICQRDENSCGLAVLRTLLMRLSGDTNYRFLVLKGKPPYSLATIIEGAKKEGCLLNAYEVDCSEVYQAKEFPFIALVGKRKEHCVLVLRSFFGFFLLFDPASGQRLVSKKQFEEMFSGVYLKVESYEKQKFAGIAPRLEKSLFPLVSSILEIAGDAFLLFALRGISSSENIVISIFLLVSYGLICILKRMSQVSSLKKFDSTYLSYLDDGSECLKDRYSLYYSYKTTHFATPLSCLSSLLSSIAFLWIFGFNQPSFLLSSSLVLLLSLVDNLFLTPFLERRKMLLASKERSIYSEGGREERNQNILETSKMSYSLGDFIIYRRITHVVACALLALLCSFLDGRVLFNVFILNFFALMAFREGISKAIEIALGEEKRLPLKVDFLLNFVPVIDNEDG